MEKSAVPLLAERQQSSAKLFNITPTEALERRAEFEPQIREVYDGYHVPEKTHMKGPTRRRAPGLRYSYIDDDNFIVYYYQFDCVVAIFYTIMLAYLNDNSNDIYYLSEFYAWAYWCDTGSTKLPQEIIDKANEAKLLREKRNAEQRQKREAEEAKQQEEMEQLARELFSRYFYADDVESGKVPLDSGKMADCLAFREIAADVRELALADYFHYGIANRLSDQQPVNILFYTLAKAMEFEDSGKICFANAWNEDGHFDLNCFKQGELNREQLKLEAEKVRLTNQGKKIPEQFARKQFDCICKGIPCPTYCEIQGKQIEWIANPKKIATEQGEKESEETEHLIKWGEDQYKRQDFFAAAYPEQYNRVKRRVNFLGAYENDVLRLTTGQRTKLMYNILAHKYRDCLVPVDKADENTLKVLCDEERNNPTASDLLSRLRWTDGLSKLVTFGVGMKAGGAAKYTWCYTVDFSGNSAKYHGADMTWEIWGSNLTFILDNYNEPLPPKKSEDLETVFRRTLYFQNGKRLTLTEQDYSAIMEWKSERLLDRKAPFPLTGPMPDKDYSFTIEYDSENLEYPENRNLRNPGEMAEYNRANNRGKGIERIRERFIAATGGTLKPGDKITAAQLKEYGYTNPNAITRLVNSKTIARVQKGVYVVNFV